MSPYLSELSLDHQYPVPVASDDFKQSCDTSPTLVFPAPGPVPDFYASENQYMCQWHDVDGGYQWADAPPVRSEGCLGYSPSSYLASPFRSDAIPLADYFGYRHGGGLEELSCPATVQDNGYIFQLAQQVRNSSGRPQVQDHRLSIARASDNFLAQGSSIFSDGRSSSRRGSTVDYRSSMLHQTNPQHDARPPSRKRSRDSLDEGSYHVKEENSDARPSPPAANDACRPPQSHVLVQSQTSPSSSMRVSRLNNATPSSSVESHIRGHEPCLRAEERCTISVPKHMNNKRVHRSNGELLRQDSSIPSVLSTWPIPEDQVMKGTKKPGEQKKQALACLFCRERKIACGRPPAHSPDQTCNQCARRRIKCEYPTESRRGQHKRRRKPIETEPANANQSTTRTNSMSNSSSTIVTTITTPSA